MDSPLNINLIIPFKDNKRARRNLYRTEIDRFRSELEGRVTELRGDIEQLFGSEFELTISSRSDGTTKKFYWRFRSSKRDRKYVRLNANSVVEYFRTLNPDQVIKLKLVEEELIYINANLRLLKGMTDAIVQSETEMAGLLGLSL